MARALAWLASRPAPLPLGRSCTTMWGPGKEPSWRPSSMPIAPTGAPTSTSTSTCAGMRPSATVAINERCDELRRDGRKVFKLGLGQSPFPGAAAGRRGAAGQRATRRTTCRSRGCRRCARRWPSYHRRSPGARRSAEDVLIGPGSKELMFLLQLVYYGDLVIPTPSWVSYAPQAQHRRPADPLAADTDAENGLAAGARRAGADRAPRRPGPPAHRHPELPQQPDRRHLHGRASSRSSPSVARRYRVILLSDEIYGELHHRGRARLDRALLPRGHDRQRRAEQVVRRRRLAAGHVHLPAAPALAARRDGRGGQRDLHLDQRADPVRRGARLPGRDARSSATWSTRARILRRARPLELAGG